MQQIRQTLLSVPKKLNANIHKIYSEIVGKWNLWNCLQKIHFTMAVFLFSCNKNNLALLSNRRQLPIQFRYLKLRTKLQGTALIPNWLTEFKAIKLIQILRMLRRRLSNFSDSWHTNNNNIINITICNSTMNTTNKWLYISKKVEEEIRVSWGWFLNLSNKLNIFLPWFKNCIDNDSKQIKCVPDYWTPHFIY